VATFVYTGTNTGQDQIQALAFINGNAAYSNQVSKTWTGSNGGGAGGASGCLAPPLASPGLIGSPVNRSSQSGSVSITATQQIVSGTVQYWPVSDPYLPPAASSIITLATNISGTAGAAGATLANLDTTLLSNGAYVIRLCENGDGTTPASASLALINVIGENKPGRVAFSLTDLTIPVAGLPVVVGRSYDSLNRNQLGDFGYGWDLTVSSPRLEVNQAGDVTLTTLDGKRVTFFFTPSSSFFGYGAPIYQPEAGVYGSLSLSPGQCLAVLPVSSGGYWCFPGEQYNPSSYDYRDPYGRLFTISRADASSPFKLTKLQDLNGNLLSFTDTGITSKSPQGDLGQLVQFGRKASNDQYCANCIQFITVTNVPGNQQFYTYTNTTGDLTQVQYPQLMPGSSTAISVTYDYYTSTNLIHLFRQANDPLNHRMVLSEYDASGRLITVTDALNNHTSYTYTLGTTPTTIVTNPDGGVVSTQTDSYGKPTTEMVQVTPTFSRTTTSGYDPLHQLTSKTIAGQLTTNYSYDTGGHQTQLGTVLTAGKSLTTTTGYNAYGGPLSIKDPVSHTWNVGYDDNFMPTVVTDTSGAIGGYSFDGRGSILSRTDGNGKPTSFTYDGYGNKTKETDPLGNSTQYGYDNLGQTTYMTDSLGIATKYNYDPLGHLVSSIQAYTTTTPLTTTFGYDANGNKHTETDALGRTTTYDYDSANRLITTTFPAVSGVVYTGTVSYDWRGNKLSETDQAGHMTKYAYDLAGQLITTTYGLDSGGNPTADTATVVNEYDSVGRKSKEFNPYPGTTLPASWATWPYVGYTYDGAGRLITLTNQLGNATGYGYDDASRKISETNALTNTTSFVYDGRGRLVKTTYPTLTNGTVISTSQGYDGAGNLITKTNELGNTTKYSYDDASRLKNVSIPITQSQNYYQTTSYNYDALGRLKTIIDANLHSTGFEYDVLGRQTKKIWPDNSFEKYDYDGLGNRTSYRLSDGNINTFSYDEWNRLKQGNFFDGRVVTYTYTPTGQRYQVVDSSRGITPTVYSYDNRDRIITATQPSGNKVSYGYDALSNRTSLTTNVGGVISTTQYGYSPASQLLTVTATTDPTGQHTIFSYDPVGRRLQLSLPNGVASHYQYDQLDRLTAITQALGINTPFASYNYELTPVGNRKTITETTNYTGTTVTRNLNYTYDDASRLLSEYSQQTGSPSITTTYQYDAVGNRLLMGTGVLTNTYKFNELDQLTTVLSGTTPTAEYSYKRGNLIQIKNSISNTVTQSYQWDAADRLTSATVYTTSSTTANYSYDADGHRIKQTVGSAVTNYLWDEFSKYGDVALEMDGNNAVTASYVLGTACSCSHALQQLISQKRGGVVNYYLFDAQDNVRVLADSNGTITDQYSYTAFGQLKSSSGTTNNTFRYTGQQFDSLTGLYNLRARYYNPIDGRFLSRDSASYQAQNPVELNRYGYTANNPINFNDPGGYGFEYFTSIFGSPEHAVPLILVAGAAIVVIASLALLLYGNIAPFIISDADEYPDEAKDSPSPEPYADANGGMQGPPCGKSYLDKDTTDLKPMPDGVIISNPSVKSTLQGPYIYVVTLEGKLLLAPQNDLSYHHPDLVNGANVAYAGVMIFSSGKLVSWDNSSGHYKPYAGENETKCIKKWMKDYSGWGFTDEEIGKWMWWLPHQE
jgi:RHS repeat-associated protein